MLVFKKQKHDFHQLLLEQTEKTLEGLTAFADFVRAPNPAKGMVVRTIERQADELRANLLEALERTSPPRLPREDVAALSRAVGEMLYYAERAAAEIMLFEVPVDKHLRKLAEVVREEGGELVEALRHLPGRPRASEEYVIRVRKTGSLAERVHRRALAELCKNPNVVTILKTRELYRHLSDSAEKGGEAAEIIGDILAKNA
ncbi:MAG: hypothetical protein ABIJ96_11825 [Elusimicrobiota bacterium]